MARESLKNVLNMIDSIKQKLTPEEEFLNDLRRSIELDSIKNKREPSRTYKPSGMNCMRQSYYVITGAPEDNKSEPYTFVGICASGSEIHERIQKSVAGMIENNMPCEYIDVAEYVDTHNLDYLEVISKQGMETKLYHKVLNMSFLCDGIIKYKGTYYILELKTETSNKFWSRQGVDPSHFNQATAYSMALDINNVLFIYISRDNSEMKSFMFEVTDDLKNNLLSYIEECDKYIEKSIVPPIPDPEPKKACQYCHYRLQCRKDG